MDEVAAKPPSQGSARRFLRILLGGPRRGHDRPGGLGLAAHAAFALAAAGAEGIDGRMAAAVGRGCPRRGPFAARALGPGPAECGTRSSPPRPFSWVGSCNTWSRPMSAMSHATYAPTRATSPCAAPSASAVSNFLGDLHASDAYNRIILV